MKPTIVILFTLYLAGCSSTSKPLPDNTLLPESALGMLNPKKLEELSIKIHKIRKKAEQGDAVGQHNFGLLNYYGVGVPLDLNESIWWFLKSANQGIRESQINLGIAYRVQVGRGVETDIINAYIWFSIASVNGSKLAPEYRDHMAQFMSRVQIEGAQRTAGEMLENNPKLIQKKK